jgi:predicted secreted protein
MFKSWMLLAAEANGVVALRMMKLMRGGRSARREANLMVSEKIIAAFEATTSLVAGASGDEIVHRYRQPLRKMRSGLAETVCLSEHDADGSCMAGHRPSGRKCSLQ